MAPDDLDALMTAARDGDAEAFAQVIERTQHVLRAALLRETADAELADELAQEALARGWAKREQYRPGTSPRAWLIAIGRNQVIEHFRRIDRDRRHLHDLVRSELLRHRPGDDGTSRGELLAALRQCLDGLAHEHRQLIELVHAQGLSSDDAGAQLGIRADACRQRLSRITRRLRACAEERVAGGTAAS